MDNSVRIWMEVLLGNHLSWGNLPAHHVWLPNRNIAGTPNKHNTCLPFACWECCFTITTYVGVQTPCWNNIFSWNWRTCHISGGLGFHMLVVCSGCMQRKTWTAIEPYGPESKWGHNPFKTGGRYCRSYLFGRVRFSQQQEVRHNSV